MGSLCLGMWAMRRSISSGFERLPIASHPEIRSRAKLRTSSRMLSNMQGQCQDLTKSMPLGSVQSPREKLLSWTLAKSPCARPSPGAHVQDPRQGPLCRTQARGPCAGPILASQGPMCKTHAVPVYTGPKLLLPCCCCYSQAGTRDSANFSTRGHDIPISMMNQDHPHAT